MFGNNKRNFVDTMRNLDCPDLDSYIPDLKKVTNSIKVLSAVNPTNSETEHKKWLDHFYSYGDFSNPTFEYEPQFSLSTIETKRRQLDELADDLSCLVPAISPSGRVPEAYLDRCGDLDPRLILAGLIFEQIKRAKRRLEFLYALTAGEESFLPEASKDAFSFPTPRLVTYAGRVLEDGFYHEPSDGPLLDAAQIQLCLNWALSFYDLKRLYDTIVVPNLPAIKVSHPTSKTGGTIKIPANRKVAIDKMRCLIAHEVESHILDKLNAKTILHDLPRIGAELVSEGHAIMNEERSLEYLHGSLQTSTTYLEKTLLVYGIHRARSGASFATVSRIFLDWYLNHSPAGEFTEEDLLEKVWTDTLRIFRGCTDTSNPYRYAFTKDHAYLSGVETVAYPLYRRKKTAWLSTGLSSLGWLEYLIPRFELRACDLPYRNRGVALSTDFDHFVEYIVR